MVATAAGIAGALLPYLPLIGKFALGMLPTNAASVVGKVVDTVKQGIAITTPVLNTLDTVRGADARGEDISLAEMDAALAALKAPSDYEAAMQEAKSKP